MTFGEMGQLTTAAVAVATLVGTMWNSFQHKATKLLIAQLELNLRREFNGRYITIQRFEDYKEHLNELLHNRPADEH